MDRLQVREGAVAGWATVILANERIAVTVLADKGADIYSFVDVPSGTDVLCKTPWGLQPQGAPAREGSAGDRFLENYEGAWQELFPSCGDPCVHAGRMLPMHGEVATEPWDWEVCERTETVAAVRFSVECSTAPLRLERVMRLRSGSGRVELDETVTNLGNGPERFVWGHHVVLGAPLVGAGARLRTAARLLLTNPDVWEETARVAPGQRGAWPWARLRAGGYVDLSGIPGPEQGSHDDVYLGELDAGWAEVENDGLGLGFRLDWDRDVFPWMVAWQPYGGAEAMPLRGIYGLGVEPWVSRGNLEQAVSEGEALELAPGARLHTSLAATIYRIATPVSGSK